MIGFFNRLWSDYWSSVDTRNKASRYFSEIYMYDSPDKTVSSSIRNLVSRLYSEQIRLKKLARSNLFIGSFVVVFSLYFIFTSLSEIDAYSRKSNEIELERRINQIQNDQKRVSELYLRCVNESNFILSGKGPAYADCIRYVSELNASIQKRQESQIIIAENKMNFKSMDVNEIYSMITRFTFIILLQIISFFFLRLYVSNNSGIKYFANEITNLESKYIAFLMSKESGGDIPVGTLINELARTERNFILVRGERTAFNSDEPRIRDLSESLSSLIEQMKGVAKGGGSEKGREA